MVTGRLERPEHASGRRSLTTDGPVCSLGEAGGGVTPRSPADGSGHRSHPRRSHPATGTARLARCPLVSRDHGSPHHSPLCCRAPQCSSAHEVRSETGAAPRGQARQPGGAPSAPCKTRPTRVLHLGAPFISMPFRPGLLGPAPSSSPSVPRMTQASSLNSLLSPKTRSRIPLDHSTERSHPGALAPIATIV